MNEITDALFPGSKESVQYIKEEITHICRDLKKRAPGTEGEREAAEYMAGILQKDCGCRSVKTEVFTAHPSAFYSYCIFTAVLGVLCAAGFFVLPWLGILFGVMELALFLVQFVLYKQLIDPLFPKRESVNVTAVRSCSKDVRQRVFLNGHVDASWEFPLNYYFGGIVFESPGAMTLVGTLFYIGISICAVCKVRWAHTAGLIGLIFIPFFILVAFTYNPRRIVDGANDNLSGCYMGIALLREMEKQGIRLEHTEVGVILTGCEEAGLRGAKAWCKVHRDDFRDVPTFVLCFDTIHDPEYLAVNVRDLNDTVASDMELGKAFLQAAQEAGVPCKKTRVPLFGGSTDSAAFTQGGFRSVGITGLNHVLEDYYHTRRDTSDNLNEEGLENCYKATVRLIENIEQTGLPEK